MGAHMKIRKQVAVLAIAALAFTTPSIVPANAHGSAWASPWPAVAVLVGTVSVMLNAAIVWNTQCRELTSAEAMTSTFLPFIGIALNAQTSKCHH